MDHHRHLLLTLYEPESRHQRVIGGNDGDSGDDDPGDDAGGAGPPNEEVTGQVGEEVREAV